MEKAHKKCPWNPEWRKDLIQAYEMVGDTEKAEALKQKARRNPGEELSEEALMTHEQDFVTG